MTLPTWRVEHMKPICNGFCSWKTRGRGLRFCGRLATFRCIVRPVGSSRDRKAVRRCLEHAHEWAAGKCPMPLGTPTPVAVPREHWLDKQEREHA